MEIGAASPLRAARDAIHSPSRHSQSSDQTREPVAGGSSEKKPSGSAFSAVKSFHREVIRYL